MKLLKPEDLTGPQRECLVDVMRGYADMAANLDKLDKVLEFLRDERTRMDGKLADLREREAGLMAELTVEHGTELSIDKDALVSLLSASEVRPGEEESAVRS